MAGRDGLAPPLRCARSLTSCELLLQRFASMSATRVRPWRALKSCGRRVHWVSTRRAGRRCTLASAPSAAAVARQQKKAGTITQRGAWSWVCTERNRRISPIRNVLHLVNRVNDRRAESVMMFFLASSPLTCGCQRLMQLHKVHGEAVERRARVSGVEHIH